MVIVYDSSNDEEEVCDCQDCSCQECTCGQCECSEEVVTEENTPS